MPDHDLTATASSMTTASTPLIAAQGAKSFINIDSIEFTNTSATATFVDVLFGATVVLQKIPVPAGLGSGCRTFDKPVRLPENTALNFQSSVGVTSVYANATYHIYPYSPG